MTEIQPYERGGLTMDQQHYRIEPDGDGEPTLWEPFPADDPRPRAVARRCDTPPELWALAGLLTAPFPDPQVREVMLAVVRDELAIRRAAGRGWRAMFASDTGALADTAGTAVPQPGCRTLCQYPGCGQPIEVAPEWVPYDWWHLRVPPEAVPGHLATPVEQPEPTRGERLVADVEDTVAAYQRGRAEGLADFATHLRDMAGRGVNERITGSLLSIADIADRYAWGEQR